MKRILVTGASGFIGRNIATALANQGADFDVTGVDIQPWTVDNGPPFSFLLCPYWEMLPRIGAGDFDVVVHQAAITNTLAPDGPELDKTNATGVSELANACVRSRSKLILASSASIYEAIAPGHSAEVGDEGNASLCTGPLNPYAMTKLRAEEYLLEAAGLDFTAFRYTNVFGPGEESKGPMACILTQIIKQWRRGEYIRLFNDTLLASRDFIPVSRVIDAVTRSIETPEFNRSRIFNLGSGVSLSFAEILQWIGSRADGDIRVKLVPNPVKDAYQYRTSVQTKEVEAALQLPALTQASVLAAAGELADSLSDEGFS